MGIPALPAILTGKKFTPFAAAPDVIRLAPPLIVTEADIEDAVGRLARVFEAIEAETAGATATAKSA